MRPLIVVMPNVLPEHSAEVTFRQDQHPVQALASTAPDPPFGLCVRPRCHEWGQNHLGSVRAEDAIEAARELPIVIVNYQREFDPLFLQLPAEVASLLRDPGCVWLRRTGSRQDTTGAEVDEHQHVQPLEEHGIDAEEVGGHQRLSMGSQELLPGQLGSATCGRNMGAPQDRTNRGRGDRVSELEQLASNPKTTPP
jgi:hypothetical protein